MSGYSLHIGLNRVDPARYDGWDGALSGCVNDAHSMTALATAEGFTTTTLIDDQASSQAVIGEISLLAQLASPGDICLITYSGHGGQVDDNNGDEDDTLDETWVLFDRQVVDDELHQMWSQFAGGVRLVVVSDSCHSGTVAKHRIGIELRRSYLRTSREVGMPVVEGAALEQVASRPRAMPPAVQAADNAARRGTYQFVQALSGSRSGRQFDAGVILLSGCQDNQLSFDGAVNGQFTGVLLQVWADGGFTGGYRDFHAAILAQMPHDQTPNLYPTGAVSAAFLAERPFTVATGTSGGTGGGISSGGSTNGAGANGAGPGGGTLVITRPVTRRGMTGQHVTYLQERLVDHGFTASVDGVFGPGTEMAVRSFQRSNGLTADGVVGPETWAAIG